MDEVVIENVEDTAFWVAAYRVLESKRPDALFHDPLAERLVGTKGLKIAAQMPVGTANAVIVRNMAMDALIMEAIEQHGADAVINLGCGLDTRAFRLSLPHGFPWYDVDFPSMIQHKMNTLPAESAPCQLHYVSLDLRDDASRQKFLASIDAKHRRAVLITEGVLYYLSEAENERLCQDLLQHKSCHFWVQDYLSLGFGKYFMRRLTKDLNRAPFKFMPDDWVGFFTARGWKEVSHRYTVAESRRLGRPLNYDGKFAWMRFFMLPRQRKRLEHLAGYVLLEQE